MDQEFFYRLSSRQGVSDREINIQKTVVTYIEGFADEVRREVNGNTTGILNPDSSFKVLLAGHIDEIGLMVTGHTEEGFLRAARVGGITPRMYLGQKVRVDTGRDLVYGAVASSGELQKKGELSDTDPVIDIGTGNREVARRHIPAGSDVVFGTDWRPLLGEYITSRAPNDHSGTFIVIEALRRAKEKKCGNGVYAVTMVGEETGFSGGAWAGAGVRPNMAVAVDVIFASDGPGGDGGVRGRVALGGGPDICVGIMGHPVMNRILEQAAGRLDIRMQPVTTPGRTFTDTDVVHISGHGVPAALVSLPLRYMHTPTEVCSLKDIRDCTELISEFVCMVNGQTDLRPC